MCLHSNGEARHEPVRTNTREWTEWPGTAVCASSWMVATNGIEFDENEWSRGYSL